MMPPMTYTMVRRPALGFADPLLYPARPAMAAAGAAAAFLAHPTAPRLLRTLPALGAGEAAGGRRGPRCARTCIIQGVSTERMKFIVSSH